MMRLRLALLIIAFACALPASSQNADIRILRSINHPVNNGLDKTMRGVSNSVPAMAIAVPVGITVYDLCKSGKLQQRDYIIAGAVGGAFALSYGIKVMVNRPRPFVTYTDIIQRDFNVGPYSFPSGHTATAFSIATSLSLCFQKWYVAVPAYAWAGTVAYSRMRLGVHYPTDVLMGAVIGSASAIASDYIVRWIYRRHHPPPRPDEPHIFE